MFSAQHKFGRLGAPAGRSLEAAIRALFADGVIYDPSDFGSLFQDSAGTTPVTALEQPVGLMKDKSGNNRHAYHTPGDTTTRPTVSRRINLLTKTEDFADAAWLKVAASVSSATAPDGTSTAWTITGDGTSAIHSVRQGTSASGGRSFTFIAKAGTNNFLQVFTDGTSNEFANFNLSTGAVGSVGTDASGATITAYGSGWYVCSVTFPVANSTTHVRFALVTSATAARAETNTLSTTVSVWRPMYVNSDLSSLPYQRVNTTTDYDSDPSKFPTFLRTDGVNDSLQTNAIDFSGTDKMFVGAAVRKLSDAARGMVMELSSTFSNPGVFQLNAPEVTSYSFLFASGGSLGATGTAGSANGTYAAPISAVLSGIGNISGDSAILRVNGAQAASGAQDQGTGNYGNHKLYLFMRGGTSLPFNGWFFGSLIKGATLSASQIALAERWLASKTKTVVLA